MSLQLIPSVLFVPGFHALLPTQLGLMLYYCPSLNVGYTCGTSDCQNPPFSVRLFALAQMLLACPSRKAVQVSGIDLTLPTPGAGRPQSMTGGVGMQLSTRWDCSGVCLYIISPGSLNSSRVSFLGYLSSFAHFPISCGIFFASGANILSLLSCFCEFVFALVRTPKG